MPMASASEAFQDGNPRHPHPAFNSFWAPWRRTQKAPLQRAEKHAAQEGHHHADHSAPSHCRSP